MHSLSHTQYMHTYIVVTQRNVKHNSEFMLRLIEMSIYHITVKHFTPPITAIFVTTTASVNYEYVVTTCFDDHSR